MRDSVLALSVTTIVLGGLLVTVVRANWEGSRQADRYLKLIRCLEAELRARGGEQAAFLTHLRIMHPEEWKAASDARPD